MPSFNKVVIAGNLCRDPELRYTGSGSPVCGMSLAINDKYKTKSGESREEVCYIDVTVWGSQGENCNNYLNKGSSVLVEGKLKQEKWTDKTTNQERTKHGITADKVVFMDSKGSIGNLPQQSSPKYQAPVNQQVVREPPPMPDFNSEAEEQIPF